MTRRDYHTSTVDGAAAFDRDHTANYDDDTPSLSDLDPSDMSPEYVARHKRRRAIGYDIPNDPWAGGAA